MHSIEDICKELELADLTPIIVNKRRVRVNIPANKRDEISELVLRLFAGSVRNSKRYYDIVLPNKFTVLVKPKSAPWQAEDAALYQLKSSIQNAVNSSGEIGIHIGDRVLHGVADVLKCAGFNKSDFYLCDRSKDPLFHISHKKGGTARDFQQWSGLTEERIVGNPHVQNFIKKCQSIYSGRMPNATSAYMHIPTDPDGLILKLMAVYGVAFDSDKISPNRADAVIQGGITLTDQSSTDDETTFRLKSNHILLLPTIPNNDYEPVMSIIYKGDRNQFGIGGARMSIYPIGGRNFKMRIPYED